MAYVPIVALQDPVIPLDARSSTSLRCDEGLALRQTAVRLLSSLIELRRTLVRAPDVCDYHVRSRVMESLAATEEH